MLYLFVYVMAIYKALSVYMVEIYKAFTGTYDKKADAPAVPNFLE